MQLLRFAAVVMAAVCIANVVHSPTAAALTLGGFGAIGAGLLRRRAGTRFG